MKLIILLLSFFIPILVGILFYKLKVQKKNKKDKGIETTINAKKNTNNIVEYLNNSASFSRYLDKQRIYLSQMGANYMFGSEIEPSMFLGAKILFALLFGLVGIFAIELNNTYIKAIIVVLLAYVGFKLLNGILKISNDSDNDDMLRDIKALYDTLKIQTNAGVFITQIIQESYLFVGNKRLKVALKEMNRTIIVRNDIEYALEEFGMKFKNQYIDMLVMTIEQSLQTGQARQMLADISAQMTDVEHAINIKEKAKLENKILLIQLALYGGILMATVYVLIIELAGVFNQL